MIIQIVLIVIFGWFNCGRTILQKERKNQRQLQMLNYVSEKQKELHMRRETHTLGKIADSGSGSSAAIRKTGT